MRRRDFIAGFAGSAAAWPTAMRAQERVRRVGIVTDTAADNPEGKARVAAIRQRLEELGWTDGQNIRIDYRWAAGDAERGRRYAAELVAFQPDVIFALANAQLAPLARQTQTIPIVFVGISDPIGPGYVASFARPGGNITGFTLYESSMSGKWVGALKEVAPHLARLALMANPDTAVRQGTFYVEAFRSTAAALSIEPVVTQVRSVDEIETSIARLAEKPGSGLIVSPDSFTQAHDARIVQIVAQHRLPALYGNRSFVAVGGLMSYGPNFIEIVRRSAEYIDRILRGARPAELPVQTPTKFELAINLRTAKALGLTIPPTLLARADEVIE